MKIKASAALTALPALVAIAVFVSERRRPLRQRSRAQGRQLTNVCLAVVGAPVTALVEKPLLLRIAAAAEARRWGLLNRLRLPSAARHAASVALLDYAMFVWHVLLHGKPLWRFHEVHHLDPELDASTALRFHVGELVASIPFRACFVLAVGASPRSIEIWFRLFASSVLFHHANVRLPEHLERALANFIVTPRMHGIHHSNQPTEQHANWSSGLTLWDKLHGSFRFDVPQDVLRMGTPSRPSPPLLPARAWVAWPFREEPTPPARAAGASHVLDG